MATSPNNPDPPTPGFPTTTSLLHHLYADLRRISQIASPDIVLHRFDRPHDPLMGRAAAQAHEEGLYAATRGALVMDVESITANAHFGAVLGVLRASKPGLPDLAVPFCGLWRFQGGWAVEHWENAHCDVHEVGAWLAAGGSGEEAREKDGL